MKFNLIFSKWKRINKTKNEIHSFNFSTEHSLSKKISHSICSYVDSIFLCFPFFFPSIEIRSNFNQIKYPSKGKPSQKLLRKLLKIYINQKCGGWGKSKKSVSVRKPSFSSMTLNKIFQFPLYSLFEWTRLHKIDY